MKPITYCPLRRSPDFKERWLPNVRLYVEAELASPHAVPVATLRELRELEHAHGENLQTLRGREDGPPWWSNPVFDRMPPFVQHALLLWESSIEEEGGRFRRLRETPHPSVEYLGRSYVLHKLRALYVKPVLIGRRFGSYYTVDVSDPNSLRRLRRLEKAVYVRRSYANPTRVSDLEEPSLRKAESFRQEEPVRDQTNRIPPAISDKRAARMDELAIELEEMRAGIREWNQETFEEHDALLTDSMRDHDEILTDEADPWELDQDERRDQGRQWPDKLLRVSQAVPRADTPEHTREFLAKAGGVIETVLRPGRKTAEQKELHTRLGLGVLKDRESGVTQAAIAKELGCHLSTVARLERDARRRAA